MPIEAAGGATLSDQPEAMARGRPAPPSTMVIFGAGDLTHRLLVPALYNLRIAGLLPDEFSILCLDVRDIDRDSLVKSFLDFLGHFAEDRGTERPTPVDGEAASWLMQRIRYLRGDFEDPETYVALSREVGKDASIVFYLAVPARFFGPIVDRLAEAGLLRQEGEKHRRVVIEKPFGHDLASARALNARLLAHMDEEQIYRIDHYLGKETVQNIMALRFSNGIFEPIWTRDNIDHVQITVAETVGVEGRGRFYEGTGALRDMVPNHMFQLLAMVAMEAPTSFEADAVRTEKAKVIQAVHPLEGRAATQDVVRGQYRPGHGMLGYRQEPDVDPNSSTETYVAMKLTIDNWRWAGVPFYLRTGKRLARRNTHIAIHFKQAPYALFRETTVEKLTPNIMTLNIQPTEGVSLQFSAKIPGPSVRLGGVRMAFDYADYFHVGPSTGYETLLYDVLIGDATLFQRADNVEAGWRVVQPALESWDAGHIHLSPYEAGSEGPEAADELLARDHRHWLPLSR